MSVFGFQSTVKGLHHWLVPMDDLEDTGSAMDGQAVEDFLVMEEVGAGGLSTVHLAQHIPTGN
jgi:hypothetical protein